MLAQKMWLRNPASGAEVSHLVQKIDAFVQVRRRSLRCKVAAIDVAQGIGLIWQEYLPR